MITTYHALNCPRLKIVSKNEVCRDNNGEGMKRKARFSTIDQKAYVVGKLNAKHAVKSQQDRQRSVTVIGKSIVLFKKKLTAITIIVKITPNTWSRCWCRAFR